MSEIEAKALAMFVLFVMNVLTLPSLPAAAVDSIPSRPPWFWEFWILVIVSCSQFDLPAEVAPNNALEVVLRLDTDIIFESYATIVKEACALVNR